MKELYIAPELALISLIPKEKLMNRFEEEEGGIVDGASNVHGDLDFDL